MHHNLSRIPTPTQVSEKQFWIMVERCQVWILLLRWECSKELMAAWYKQVIWPSSAWGPGDMLLLSSPIDGGRQPWSNWLVSLSGYYSQDNIYALHLYWLSHRRTNTERLTSVYRNQHVIYICCGFGLVMSGVYLFGVIGWLSIYCKLPVIECLSLDRILSVNDNFFVIDHSQWHFF